jgi:hypothetical protein
MRLVTLIRSMTAVPTQLLVPPSFVFCRTPEVDHPGMVGQNSYRKTTLARGSLARFEIHSGDRGQSDLGDVALSSKQTDSACYRPTHQLTHSLIH